MQLTGWIRSKEINAGIILRGKEKYILFDKFGTVMNPIHIDRYGYWAFLRFADLLPDDYRPVINNNWHSITLLVKYNLKITIYSPFIFHMEINGCVDKSFLNHNSLFLSWKFPLKTDPFFLLKIDPLKMDFLIRSISCYYLFSLTS